MIYVEIGTTLRQIGVLWWHKDCPQNREFASSPLTDDDKKHGLLDKPVYEIIDTGEPARRNHIRNV